MDLTCFLLGNGVYCEALIHLTLRLIILQDGIKSQGHQLIFWYFKHFVGTFKKVIWITVCQLLPHRDCRHTEFHAVNWLSKNSFVLLSICLSRLGLSNILLYRTQGSSHYYYFFFFKCWQKHYSNVEYKMLNKYLSDELSIQYITTGSVGITTA